jgi:hypothetical protein
MANYKTMEVKISYFLWSDAYGSYMVSSNPECMWRVVCVVHCYKNMLGVRIIHKNTS